MVPGASADWQIVLADGTALGDIRYILQTDDGDLLYVQSRGVRHGSADVLARLGRGEDVDASEYTFRTSTQIETATSDLDWLNKGVFISVAGRQPGGVIYETYLVGMESVARVTRGRLPRQLRAGERRTSSALHWESVKRSSPRAAMPVRGHRHLTLDRPFRRAGLPHCPGVITDAERLTIGDDIEGRRALVS